MNLLKSIIATSTLLVTCLSWSSCLSSYQDDLVSLTGEDALTPVKSALLLGASAGVYNLYYKAVAETGRTIFLPGMETLLVEPATVAAVSTAGAVTTTTVHNARVESTRKIIQLLKDSELRFGLVLSEVQDLLKEEGVEVDLEEIASIVLDLDDSREFCGVDERDIVRLDSFKDVVAKVKAEIKG